MALPKISLEIVADPNSAVKGLGEVTKALQKVDAATHQYEKGIQELDRAMKSGLLTDAKYAASLSTIEKEYREAATAAATMGGGVARFTKATQAASSAANLNSHSTRMMAMQLSQVGQQTMVTGNFLQALAIQLPDLALGFGAMGIAAGVAGGVLLQTMLPAVLDAIDGVADLEDALADAEDAFEAVEKATEDTSKSLDQLHVEVGGLNTTLGRLNEIMRDLEVQALNNKITDLANSIERELGLSAAIGATNLLDVQLALESLGVGAEAARKGMHSVQLEFGQMNAALEAGEMEMAGLHAENLAADLVRMAEESGGATDEMIALISALRTFIQLRGQAGSFDPLGVTTGEGLTLDTPNLLPPIVPDDPDKGGGGGRADQFSRRLERLQESLMTEREVVENWLAESEQLLNEARERELIGEAEHKEQMLRLEKEYQERLSNIKDGGRTRDLQAVLGSGQETLQALGAFNEKALRMAQVFGAAKAFVSTYEGAAEALKLPFPANLAAAASVISSGLGFVAAIKSVGSGGSIGGGAVGVGAGAVGSSPAAPAPLDVRLSGMSADQFISGASLETLFDRLQDEAGDRGLRVSFAQ